LKTYTLTDRLSCLAPAAGAGRALVAVEAGSEAGPGSAAKIATTVTKLSDATMHVARVTRTDWAPYRLRNVSRTTLLRKPPRTK